MAGLRRIGLAKTALAIEPAQEILDAQRHGVGLELAELPKEVHDVLRIRPAHLARQIVGRDEQQIARLVLGHPIDQSLQPTIRMQPRPDFGVIRPARILRHPVVLPKHAAGRENPNVFGRRRRNLLRRRLKIQGWRADHENEYQKQPAHVLVERILDERSKVRGQR